MATSFKYLIIDYDYNVTGTNSFEVADYHETENECTVIKTENIKEETATPE